VPDVKVDTWGGGKFNVYEAGKGPVIMLVHPSPGSSQSWAPLLPLVEEHFSVCAPDLLGHGKSEARPEVASAQEHGASLERLCRVLGLTQAFYLAGAGFGAKVAVELALRKPKLIRGLLLLGLPKPDPKLKVRTIAASEEEAPERLVELMLKLRTAA